MLQKKHSLSKKSVDKYTQWVYNIIVTRERQEGEKEENMESEMSKADLIAMLVSIREVARTNKEMKTVEHIDKILEEIRK